MNQTPIFMAAKYDNIELLREVLLYYAGNEPDQNVKFLQQCFPEV